MKNQLLPPVRAAVLAVLALSFLEGSLNFEKQLLRDVLPEGAHEYHFEFKFTNKGEYPVKITGIKTDCGCTAATPSKDTYMPGDSGLITGTFTVGDRVGVQEKQITVLTNDIGDSEIVLVIRIEIPRTIAIRPGLLFWHKGDDAKPKETLIELASSLKLKSIQAKDGKFDVTFSRTEGEADGKIFYKVTVTPKSTQEEARATIKINASNIKTGQEKSLVMHALVK